MLTGAREHVNKSMRTGAREGVNKSMWTGAYGQERTGACGLEHDIFPFFSMGMSTHSSMGMQAWRLGFGMETF